MFLRRVVKAKDSRVGRKGGLPAQTYLGKVGSFKTNCLISTMASSKMCQNCSLMEPRQLHAAFEKLLEPKTGAFLSPFKSEVCRRRAWERQEIASEYEPNCLAVREMEVGRLKEAGVETGRGLASNIKGPLLKDLEKLRLGVNAYALLHSGTLSFFIYNYK